MCPKGHNKCALKVTKNTNDRTSNELCLSAEIECGLQKPKNLIVTFRSHLLYVCKFMFKNVPACFPTCVRRAESVRKLI